MIKEFGNWTADSSDGGFARDEGAGPSNVPGRDAGDDSDDSDDSDDDDDEEDPDEESDRDKIQVKGVVHEG